MGFGRFEIVIENRNGIFYPGQSVNGTVHVTNSKVESLKGIQIECSGLAEVRIPVKNDKNTEFRCSNEQYFDFKFCLYNPGNQVIELSVGRHQYPFTFVLPTQIPPSFEGSFGHIRYTIRSVAQRPWLKRDYACQTSLIVGSIVDLNTLPAAVLPVKKMKSKRLGCFCCTSNPITAHAKIERAGYTPGETILLKADTDNESGISLRGSKAQFIQITKFIAAGETNSDTKVLQVYSHERFTEADIMEAQFLVPQLPPSTLPFCGIIDVSYQIQYIVDPGALSINLTVTLDLLIGTVPLYSQAPNSSSNPPRIGFNPWVVPGDDWTTNASAPPPTYEESVQAAVPLKPAAK
ncbi:arrestin domain-containing protein 17-like [Daphnia pulex]|uniref:arrestin domain-containing protein 17-like n=1 Tax=Daphnia pulex TaxID=6669 RepID=UPI001EDD20D2|nr:arrestin domain-containing protein 17-like [Daphnia pulex]